MSVDIEYKIIWFLSTGLITSTLSGPKGNGEFYFPSTSMFSEAPRETLRSRGNKTHCYIAGVFPATARLFIGLFMVT